MSSKNCNTGGHTARVKPGIRINPLTLFALLMIAGATSFAVGFGMASKNVPDVLVFHAQENNRSAWEASWQNETEKASYKMWTAMEFCRLYTDFYRTEDLFSGSERNKFVPFCEELKNAGTHMIPPVVFRETIKFLDQFDISQSKRVGIPEGWGDA